MKSARSAFRCWVVLVVALSLAFFGCTAPSDRPPSAKGPEGEVARNGFAVTLDGVTVTGPAGVAPVGTGVRLARDVGSVPEELRGAVSAAPAFDISMTDGVQPQMPVTITLKLPADADRQHDALFFVTKRSDTGAWEGIPVTITGDTASVTVSHFSVGWFGWGDEIVGWFVDAVKDFLKLGFEEPACLGKTASTGGRQYSVEADNDGVHPCVTEREGAILATIESDSPFVWLYRPTPGEGTGFQGEAPLDLAGILTLAAYDFSVQYDYTQETVLVPGGKATIQLSKNVTDTWVGARVDAQLGLIAVLVAGLDIAAAMATGQEPSTWLEEALSTVEDWQNAREAGECLVGALEGAFDLEDNPGSVLNTVASCTGKILAEWATAAGGLVAGSIGVVVGIVTSLVGLLVTQIQGLVGELTDQNEVMIHITSKPAPMAPTVATMVSAGVCARGAKVTGSVSFDHPAHGQVTLATCANGSNGPAGWALFDSSGAVVAKHAHDSMWEFALANPVTDASGNYFIRYNPGRYDGVEIVRPATRGMTVLHAYDTDGLQFYYADLMGPGADGKYSIKQWNNDCKPSCASGTITSEIYRWNGDRYVVE